MPVAPTKVRSAKSFPCAIPNPLAPSHRPPFSFYLSPFHFHLLPRVHARFRFGREGNKEKGCSSQPVILRPPSPVAGIGPMPVAPTKVHSAKSVPCAIPNPANSIRQPAFFLLPFSFSLLPSSPGRRSLRLRPGRKVRTPQGSMPRRNRGGPGRKFRPMESVTENKPPRRARTGAGARVKRRGKSPPPGG